MDAFEVDVSGAADLARRLAGAPAVLEREFGTAMERTALLFEGDAKRLAPVDEGRLRQSIAREVTPFLGTVGTNLPYARVVEEGRRPGAALPPPGVLLPWMRRHGIPAELEYPVRLAIARKGIAAKRFFQQAFERNAPAARREFESAARRFVLAMGGR